MSIRRRLYSLLGGDMGKFNTIAEETITVTSSTVAISYDIPESYTEVIFYIDSDGNYSPSSVTIYGMNVQKTSRSGTSSSSYYYGGHVYRVDDSKVMLYRLTTSSTTSENFLMYPGFTDEDEGICSISSYKLIITPKTSDEDIFIRILGR